MHASPNLHATHSPHAFCSGGAGGDGREGGAEGGPGGAGGKGGAEGGAHWGQPSQCSQWHSSSHDRVLFAQNGWQVPMGGPWTLSRRGSAISLRPRPYLGCTHPCCKRGNPRSQASHTSWSTVAGSPCTTPSRRSRSSHIRVSRRTRCSHRTAARCIGRPMAR